MFFSTYNLTDNKYIEYFKIEMQKKIVYGFYKNIINLFNQSKIIRSFFKNRNIDKNIDLNNKEDVSVLYQILKQLSLTSIHNWEIVCLFEEIDVYINNLSNELALDYSQTLQITINFFILQWERIIDNYYKNKELAKFLLN